MSKWVATVTDQHWVIAKIRIWGRNVKILKVYSTKLSAAASASDSSEPEADAAAEQPMVAAAQELRQFFKKNRIPTSNFSLALSCSGVITRIVTVPVMKQKLMDILFSEQVDQYFTLNVADYIIDYRVLNQVEEEGQKRYKVLLTAVPKDYWNQLMLLVKEARLKPKCVDVQFECLSRIFSRIDSTDCAILNLSGQRVEIVILEQGLFFLFSEVYFDAQALSGLLEAETLKTTGGSIDLSKPSIAGTVYPSAFEDEQTEQDAFPSFTEAAAALDDGAGAAVESSEAEQVVERNYLEGLETIFFPVMRNLQDFLNFFSAKHFGKNIDVIYITGEDASIKDIDRVFQVNLEIPTFVGYPQGWNPKFSKKVSGLNLDAGLMGELIGLAMRRD